MGGRFGGGAEGGGNGGPEKFCRSLATAPLPAAAPSPAAGREAESARERERVFGDVLVLPCEGRRLLSLRGEEKVGGRLSWTVSEGCDRSPIESTLIRRENLESFSCWACCCW